MATCRRNAQILRAMMRTISTSLAINNDERLKHRSPNRILAASRPVCCWPDWPWRPCCCLLISDCAPCWPDCPVCCWPDWPWRPCCCLLMSDCPPYWPDCPVCCWPDWPWRPCCCLLMSDCPPYWPWPWPENWPWPDCPDWPLPDWPELEYWPWPVCECCWPGIPEVDPACCGA